MSDELPKTAAWKDVARGLGPTWASGTYELFSLADAAIEELIKLFSLADAAIEELITKLTASRLAEEFTQERAEEAEARVAELDYALDEAVKDLGNLVAAFNKTSPMEQPWGTKELAVIKGDLIRRYHTAHPDAEEGKR